MELGDTAGEPPFECSDVLISLTPISRCCEECGKTFNQISAYHVHLKVHSNVRDFACEDCGMTFKLKHSLKKHQVIFTLPNYFVISI